MIVRCNDDIVGRASGCARVYGMVFESIVSLISQNGGVEGKYIIELLANGDNL